MRYLTIEESVRQNGERHLANAKRYEAQGLPDYSAGSMRKAIRNFKRADSVRLPPLPPFLQSAVDAMAKAIADQLMSTP